MTKEILFDEINNDEKKLLLSAFDYGVDDSGNIYGASGDSLFSTENPKKALTLDNVALMPGSLEVIDGSPSSIALFLRERLETNESD